MATKPTTSKTPKSRQQGRPDSSQGVGRDSILEAAIQVLKTTSPEAMTMVDVAQRANVHPALVRYYFGSKNGLLRSAVGTLIEREQESMRKSMDSGTSLQAKLGKRLTGMIELVQENPNFHRLAMDRVYAETNEDGQDLLARMSANGMKLTLAMLHNNSEQAIRAVDPRFMHIAMVGVAEFFISAKPLLHELFGEETDFEELKKRYVDFIGDLFIHGLTPSSAAVATPIPAPSPAMTKPRSTRTSTVK